MSLFFCFFKKKLKCQILLQGTSDATKSVIYNAVTIEKSKKKSFYLVIKIVLDLLKWLKETSFYEKKKELIIKT